MKNLNRVHSGEWNVINLKVNCMWFNKKIKNYWMNSILNKKDITNRLMSRNKIYIILVMRMSSCNRR
jgi:uncharacterized membrane protein